MLKSVATAVAGAMIGGCAMVPVPEAARAELAPMGKLRAGMNLGNTLFTGKDAATGTLRGVSVDIMNELGRQLGVPVEMVVYPTPGEVADAAGNNAWDVAILAIEQARAKTISFSPPMTEIEATYMVQRDSKLKAVSEVDAAGVRIAVSDKAGYELYLTRTLQHATLVKTKGLGGAMEIFNARQTDALAGLKPALLDTLDKMPDARMLEGKFMTVNHGLGTPRGRDAAAAYLKAFVGEMVASGFIARSIEKHAVKGLSAVR